MNKNYIFLLIERTEVEISYFNLEDLMKTPTIQQKNIVEVAIKIKKFMFKENRDKLQIYKNCSAKVV